MSNNSKIDLDTLKKLGKLSRIPIDETGSNKLLEDLNEIIGFIEQLNEVDTESVNPLSSVTGHNLPIREDVVDDGNKNNGKLIVKVDRSMAFAFEHEREKIIKKINLFFGYEVINKVEIIQASIKVKKAIKINKLESDIKSQSKNYDALKNYPDLKRNFEKIASKILKS